MLIAHPARLATAMALLVALTAPAAAEVEVVCHRGANKQAPENTRAAAQLCIDWGAEYVEIDVRTSKDGVLYILHDRTVNRTTDGEGAIADLTSAEIDKLDAGSWFDPKFAGEKIPRLEPYLRWIKGKAKVYFDVKAADLQKVIALVYDVGLENDCFFWFSSPLRVAEFRKIDATLPLKINVRDAEGVTRASELYGAAIVEVGLSSMTPELIAACKRHKIKIMVYLTKNDPEGFRETIDLGADMINLNHPDVFLEIRRERKLEKG